MDYLCLGYFYELLKKLDNEIAPHLTHLFNSIIRSGIYWDVLRVSEIIPLLKSGKPSHIIDGYCPVNVLGPIDKLFQEHLKNNLEGFLDSHKIISKFHHGGRKGHSTTTALAMIQNFLYNKIWIQSKSFYHMIFSKRRLVFSVSSSRFFRSKVVNLNTRVIPIFNDTAINAEIEQVEILFDCFIIIQELSQHADLSHIAMTRNSRSRGTDKFDLFW